MDVRICVVYSYDGFLIFIFMFYFIDWLVFNFRFCIVFKYIFINIQCYYMQWIF